MSVIFCECEAERTNDRRRFITWTFWDSSKVQNKFKVLLVRISKRVTSARVSHWLPLLPHSHMKPQESKAAWGALNPLSVLPTQCHWLPSHQSPTFLPKLCKGHFLWEFFPNHHLPQEQLISSNISPMLLLAWTCFFSIYGAPTTWQVLTWGFGRMISSTKLENRTTWQQKSPLLPWNSVHT